MAGPLAVSSAVLQGNREGLGYLAALSLPDRAAGDLPLARTAMASARNEVRGLDSVSKGKQRQRSLAPSAPLNMVAIHYGM